MLGDMLRCFFGRDDFGWMMMDVNDVNGKDLETSIFITMDF
jgi:hypothetical protein